MTRIALLAFVVSLVDARVADACSCVFDITLPTDGSTGVPTNLGALMFYGRYNDDEYALHEGDLNGPRVGLGTRQPVWGVNASAWLVPLTTPLQPTTSYTLYRAGHATRFTTAATADTEPPGAITIDALSIEYIQRDRGNGSCTPNGLDITARIYLPSDAVTVWVRFTRDVLVQERLLPRATDENFVLGGLGNGTCFVPIDLQPGLTYDVELWARDLAGNEGPITATRVTVTESCGGCSSSSASAFVLFAIAPILRRRRRA